jgi:hypothetical protein
MRSNSSERLVTAVILCAVVATAILSAVLS